MVQVDPMPRCLLFSYHPADLANHVAGAPRVSIDIREEIADLLQIDISTLDKALSRTGVAGNSCERLIQFMGDGRRHLAHQSYAAEMTELLSPLLGFQFRPFSSRDVDADSQN